MNEIMYLKEVNNEIVCVNYFGKKLEKKRRFTVHSFRLNHKIVDVALYKKKLYVLLNSEIVLIFKNINMLKNEMFKDLKSDIKVACCKHYIKKIANTTNFHLHKILSKKISLDTLMSTIIAGSIAFTSFNISHSPISTLNSDDNIPKMNTRTIEENIEEEVTSTYDLPSTYNLTSTPIEIDFNESNIFDEASISDETSIIEDEGLVSKDTVTTEHLIEDNRKFYTGDVYESLVEVMNDSNKTAEMNHKINDYIYKNLKGQMWANAENQCYNKYTIPEKYKNGEFTLDELFTDAASTFNIPKDILVAISQHECGQGYYPLNSYTRKYEKNCGGMMGFLNVSKISSSHLPEGTYDGCDINTNPALSIYAYASIVRFFYDSFKDIDVGYGLDSWDISAAMIAIGPGDVSNINVGFKYRQDYEEKGITLLNTLAPQLKALREAYSNNMLGVNDLTLTAENGVITHWTDGETFYYKNGEKTFKKTIESTKILTKNN